MFRTPDFNPMTGRPERSSPVPRSCPRCRRPIEGARAFCRTCGWQHGLSSRDERNMIIVIAIIGVAALILMFILGGR